MFDPNPNMIHPDLKQLVSFIHFSGLRHSVTREFSSLCTFFPGYIYFICFRLRGLAKKKTASNGAECYRPVSIIGPKTGCTAAELGIAKELILVALQPGGLYRLLGIPLHSLVNQDLNAENLLGNDIQLLQQQLENSECNVAKQSVIEDYLKDRLSYSKPAIPFDSAIQDLIEADGNLSIDELADRSFLSVRQFERQAQIRLGLPPKFFARIIRFTHACRLKREHPELTWTSISSTCGYFDQMHFIRDFKVFTGGTPGSMQMFRLHSEAIAPALQSTMYF